MWGGSQPPRVRTIVGHFLLEMIYCCVVAVLVWAVVLSVGFERRDLLRMYCTKQTFGVSLLWQKSC